MRGSDHYRKAEDLIAQVVDFTKPLMPGQRELYAAAAGVHAQLAAAVATARIAYYQGAVRELDLEGWQDPPAAPEPPLTVHPPVPDCDGLHEPGPCHPASFTPIGDQLDREHRAAMARPYVPPVLP